MKASVRTLLITAALGTGLAAGVASAMPPGEGCGHGPRAMGFGRHGMDSEERIERLAGALGLTAEQRDKVRAIVDQSRPQTRALRDKLAENRQQLRALAQQGTPSEAEIRRLADAQGKLMADMIVQRTRVQSEINAVLTPEQREKMQQRFQRRGPLPGQPGETRS